MSAVLLRRLISPSKWLLTPN